MTESPEQIRKQLLDSLGLGMSPGAAPEVGDVSDIAVRLNLSSPPMGTPEEIDKGLRQSREMGLPKGVVLRPVEDNSERLRTLPIAEIKKSPGLTKFFSQPEAAAIAWNDVERVVEFAREMRGTGRFGHVPIEFQKDSLWDAAGKRYEAGEHTVELADSAWKKLIGESDPENDMRYKRLLRQRFDASLEPDGAASAILLPTVGQIPILKETVKGGLKQGAVGAAAGAGTGLALTAVGVPPQISVPAAALLGGKTGFTLGSAMEVFKLEAGIAYSEMEQDQEIDADVARGAAYLVGAINSSLEMVGLYSIGKVLGLKEAGRLMSASALRKHILGSEVLREGLKRLGRDIAGAVATNASEEFLQEYVTLTAAKMARGGGLSAVLPTETEFYERLLPAAEEGGAAAVGFGVAGLTVKSAAYATAKTIESNAVAEKVRRLTQAYDKMEMSTRSPEGVSILIDALAEDGGVTEFRIPADELVGAYEAGGFGFAELAADTGFSQQEIQESLAIGDDVRVPVQKYMSAVRSRVAEALEQHIRLTPEGTTVAEAQQIEEALPEELERISEHDDDIDVTLEAGRDETSRPLFDDPDSSGMSVSEWEKYQALVESADSEARKRVDARIAEDQGRELKDWWKAEREALRGDVEESIGRDPAIRALHLLRLGKFPTGETPESLKGIKIDPSTVEGPGFELGSVPRPNGIWKKGGRNAEFIAEVLGFENANFMLLAIDSVKDKTFDQRVEDMLDQRMSRRYGDPLARGQANAKAVMASIDAHINEQRIAALHFEERALAKLAGQGALPRAVLKDLATRLIGRERVGGLNPELFHRRADRAAIKAAVARKSADLRVDRGQALRALTEKRRQILNMLLYGEAKKAKTRIEKRRKHLANLTKDKRRAKIGKAGWEYLDRVDDLLSRVGLARKGKGRVSKMESFAAWLKEKEAAGEDVVVPEGLRSEAAKKHYTRMTLAEFDALYDSVTNLEHLARRKTEMMVKKKVRDREELASDLVNRLRQSFRTEEGGTRNLTPSTRDKLKSSMRAADASLTRMESLIDTLDGGDPRGPWRAAILDRLFDAQDFEEDLVEKVGDHVMKLFESYDKKTQRTMHEPIVESRLQHKGKTLVLTRWNLVMMLLNIGNKGNKTKLLDGYGWDEATLMSVIETHLTTEDVRFAQGVLDTIQSLWPHVSAMEKRLTGLAPKEVEATPITITPRGAQSEVKIRGGYFPVVYDPTQAPANAQVNGEIATIMNPGSRYTFATTAHGHTKARTEYTGPLLLEPSVITKHMFQVIHDVAFREALQDISFLLRRDDVDAAIQETLGSEFGYRDLMLPWLKAIGGDYADARPLAAWEKLVRRTRINVTTFKLLLRATTLAMQTTGNLNAFEVLRQHKPDGMSHTDLMRYYVRGLGQAFGGFNPSEMIRVHRSVLEESPTLKRRIVSFDRDMRDIARDANRLQATVSERAREFGARVLGNMQLRSVDIPAYLTSRMIAEERMGLSPAEARKFAESIVRMSQGGGTVIEMAAVQRGGAHGSEFFKASTLFYSYHSAVYNTVRNTLRGTKGGAGQFLAAYFLAAVAPEMFAEAIRMANRVLMGREPTRDELHQFLFGLVVGPGAGTIPGLRDVWPILVGQRPRPSSAVGIVYQELEDLGNVQSAHDLFWDVVRLYGLVAGLPIGNTAEVLEEATK